MKEVSEFGMGLTYCIGLFLMHAERYNHDKKEFKKMGYESLASPHSWFNGSSDHLYDLQIPEHFNDELKKRIEYFQDRVLKFGHGFWKPEATEEDVNWSIEEAKKILMEIDRTMNISVLKGDYE